MSNKISGNCSIYLTSLKTATEIGVTLATGEECCLGEIVVEQKHRRYGELIYTYTLRLFLLLRLSYIVAHIPQKLFLHVKSSGQRHSKRIASPSQIDGLDLASSSFLSCGLFIYSSSLMIIQRGSGHIH